MACFIQGKVLNDKAREKWIINIIQSMLKSIDTKISQSILAQQQEKGTLFQKKKWQGDK